MSCVNNLFKFKARNMYVWYSRGTCTCRNELQFRFSYSGPFFQIWQFFVVLHKIGHECIMTLHGHFTKITKKTKHGNVYNDRSTEKNNSQKHGFWTFARSLYKFPCFVFLVVLVKRSCNVIIHSCLILCNTMKN